MNRPSPGSALGLLGAGLIVAIGTSWAFHRGGQDFDVFYHAWSLAHAGEIRKIYTDSPDRFLYAPGFAFLFRWLSMMPRDWALALFCLGKAAVVGLMIRSLLPRKAPAARLAAAGALAWGVVLIARPMLIDFQYGQLNLILVAAAFWALRSHLSPDQSASSNLLPWLVFSILAFSKPTAAPLLLVPFVATASSPKKANFERGAILVGGLVLVLGLVVDLGPQGTWQMHELWFEALKAKAVPLESHNQSGLAILHHWFSGESIHSLVLGDATLEMGEGLMSSPMIQMMGLGILIAFAGGLLAWMFNPFGRGGLTWMAGLIALTILPSHLIWKPYFVFALPAAMLLTLHINESGTLEEAAPYLAAFAFIGLNLTGVDILGRHATAWVESSGLLLLCYLVLVGTALTIGRVKKASVRRSPAVR